MVLLSSLLRRRRSRSQHPSFGFGFNCWRAVVGVLLIACCCCGNSDDNPNALVFPRRQLMHPSALDVNVDGRVGVGEVDAFTRRHRLPLMPAAVFDALFTNRTAHVLNVSRTLRVKTAALLPSTTTTLTTAPALALAPRNARIKTFPGATSQHPDWGLPLLLNAQIYDVLQPMLGTFPSRDGSQHYLSDSKESGASLAADDAAVTYFGHAVVGIDGHLNANLSVTEVAQRLHVARSRRLRASSTGFGGEDTDGKDQRRDDGSEEAAAVILWLCLLYTSPSPRDRG